MTKNENLMRRNLIRFYLWGGKKAQLIVTLKMVASNTSKRWEGSNLSENYWFPFGFNHLPRNVSYVNNCLCGSDHFGPHPAIASDQPFCLDVPNPCELICELQTQPFLPRSVRVHWRTWAAALSLGCEELFDLVIFSQIWTRIKGAKPFKEGGKYGILSSCGPIKDRRKQEPDRWADMDVVRSAARSGLQWILYSRCTLALSGEPTVLICSCSSFSATQQFLLARLKLRSFTVFLRGNYAWMVKYSLDWDSPCQQVHADDASGSGRRPS